MQFPTRRAAARHPEAEGPGAAARRASSPGRGTLTISNVAAVEIAGTRGEATSGRLPGGSQITHRGGDVDDRGRRRRSSSTAAAGREAHRRAAATRRSRWTGRRDRRRRELGGSLDVESRNADVTLENSETTRGPIRVNVDGRHGHDAGTASRKRASTAATPRSRSTMTAPAPVAIYSEGERVVADAAARRLQARRRRHRRPDHARRPHQELGLASPRRATAKQSRDRRRQRRRPDDHGARRRAATSPARRTGNPAPRSGSRRRRKSSANARRTRTSFTAAAIDVRPVGTLHSRGRTCKLPCLSASARSASARLAGALAQAVREAHRDSTAPLLDTALEV